MDTCTFHAGSLSKQAHARVGQMLLLREKASHKKIHRIRGGRSPAPISPPSPPPASAGNTHQRSNVALEARWAGPQLTLPTVECTLLRHVCEAQLTLAVWCKPCGEGRLGATRGLGAASGHGTRTASPRGSPSCNSDEQVLCGGRPGGQSHTQCHPRELLGGPRGLGELTLGAPAIWGHTHTVVQPRCKLSRNTPTRALLSTPPHHPWVPHRTPRFLWHSP
jgi:hypothetical protein